MVAPPPRCVKRRANFWRAHAWRGEGRPSSSAACNPSGRSSASSFRPVPRSRSRTGASCRCGRLRQEAWRQANRGLSRRQTESPNTIPCGLARSPCTQRGFLRGGAAETTATNGSPKALVRSARGMESPSMRLIGRPGRALLSHRSLAHGDCPFPFYGFLWESKSGLPTGKSSGSGTNSETFSPEVAEVLVHVAGEAIGDLADRVGVFVDDAFERKFLIVKRIDQLAHVLHAAAEVARVGLELLRREVSFDERLVHGLAGEHATL